MAPVSFPRKMHGRNPFGFSLSLIPLCSTRSIGARGGAVPSPAPLPDEKSVCLNPLTSDQLGPSCAFLLSIASSDLGMRMTVGQPAIDAAASTQWVDLVHG